MYDLIIIGGGPGGVAAGVYAARKKIKTALITDTFGGQSLVSNGIENWIGTKLISGYDLAKSLEEHLRAQAGIDVVDGDLVSTVAKRDDGTFLVTTKNGKALETKYILLTSGSRRKRLGVSGEDRFDGKGVVFCTTCDAPLFGGNSALEGVEDLLQYASKIYLVVRSEVLRGDPITQEKVKSHPNVEILWNTVIEEIHGDVETQMVNGVKYKNAKSGEEKELPLDGVFIEIGLTPNSNFVKDLVQLNEIGHVVVDHKTQQTSCPGIWAAGDVSDVLYDQNNISVGDAIKATLNIYDKIKKG
jgi:alkyl hydroperoxide reductase subunit F